MPRGRPRKQPLPEAPAPAPPPEVDYETIREFYRRRATDDSYVTVLRHTETGALEFICQGSPGAIDEAFVQEKHGGGKYVFRLKSPEGDYLAQSTVMISTPPEFFGPAAPPVAEAEPYRAQLDLMRDQLARQQEMVLHLIDKQTGATGAPQNELIKVIEAVAALRTFADPGEQVKSVVSALTEGMRLGMRSNGGGGAEDKVSTALRVVERVTELVPRILPRFGAADPIKHADNPPVGTAPASNPPAGAVPEPRPDAAGLLRGTIGYLKTKIHKDPGLWADMILDNVEETHWGLVADLVDKPYDEIAELIGDPDLKREPFRSWFTKLLAELKIAYQSSVDTSGTPGNRDGPSGNG